MHRDQDDTNVQVKTKERKSFENKTSKKNCEFLKIKPRLDPGKAATKINHKEKM